MSAPIDGHFWETSTKLRIACLPKRVRTRRLDLSTSFLKCRWTGGNPARVSSAPPGVVLKAPRIHCAARLWTLRASLRAPLFRAPLKYHKRIPYDIMGITHVRYRSLLCLGERPLTELPSANIALTVVRDLLDMSLTCSLNVRARSKWNPRYLQKVLGRSRLPPV